MRRFWTAAALCAVGAPALAGCYIVSPYPYPAYAPPPSAAPSPPPRAGSPPTSPGAGAPAAAQPSGTNCQTVTVEGYNRTHVTPSGERVNMWIPTHTERVCQ
jgi:hypothetical protein